MRRLTKAEFCLIDHEVVYCACDDGFNPNDLFIKVETCSSGNDFIYQNVCGNLDAGNSNQLMNWLCLMEHDSSIDFPLTVDCASRDGCFEDKDCYFVYSKSEVSDLIRRLQSVYDGMP